MIKAILSFLASVGKLVEFLIRRWSQIQYDKDKAEMDRAIAKRDTDAMVRKFDELRVPNIGDTSGQDDKEPPKREL